MYTLTERADYATFMQQLTIPINYFIIIILLLLYIIIYYNNFILHYDISQFMNTADSNAWFQRIYSIQIYVAQLGFYVKNSK